MKFLDIHDTDFDERFAAVLGRGEETGRDVEALVLKIIADVRTRGDAALLEYTHRFDRLATDAAGLLIGEEDIDR
ncbi:MAG TPA: histidinol dehydrogenase, partial [Geobacteraceae bacterium]|nr:histidinol dehydrogenase [Geobacteraceae bacterium]